MAMYVYRAKNAAGKETKGKIEANDDAHLQSILRESHLYLLSYKKENAMNKDVDISFLQKVKLKDLTVFTRQFAAMITAGLTVVTSLDLMKDQIQNKKLKTATEKVVDEVQKGFSLSESMKQHPNIFPEILVNMVSAGELSGKLDISLERASDHFEKENALTSKIKGAMSYPAVVSIVAVVAIGFIVSFVIPGFMDVFEQVGSELPATTKFLILLSNIFRSYWYLVLIFVAALIFMYRMYVSTPLGRETVDRLKLRLPVFGPINRKVAVSRFCRTLATMLEAGLPLLDSIGITAGVVGNAYIRNYLEEVREHVGRGSGLAVPLEQTGLFPKMVTHMVAVGENTGDMESLLNKTAVFYDDEVDLAVKQLTTALEPFIIVLLGGAVAFIVISILQPMFALYQGVSNM